MDNQNQVNKEILKEENSSISSKSLTEDNIPQDINDNTKDLLLTIINTMIKKYGNLGAKNAILKYKKDKKIEYITREKDLRKKIKESTSFNNYIDSISTEDLEILINSKTKEDQEQDIEINSKEKTMDKISLLEEISKEIYKSAINSSADGEKQVAISIIKLSSGQYEYITRSNDARDIAKENISSDEVEDLVKTTLENEGYIIENDIDMYYLYANRIKYKAKEEGDTTC